MKRSFRLHLFIQIFLATVLIVLANRYLAQYHLVNQMEDRAHLEMGRVLKQCASAMTQATTWESCVRRTEKGDILNPLIDFFIPCTRISGEVFAARTACSGLNDARIDWKSLDQSVAGIYLGEVTIHDERWHLVTTDKTSLLPSVLLSDASLWNYLRKLWVLRDRNLVYALPTIILMLMGLTAYMVYVVMRPIRLMEETLSTLDFKNIHEKTDIKTPYTEFKDLANVYRDLLKRLDDSYETAKRFASDAAHELRTPLSILRGNVERLISEVPQGSNVQMYVQNLGDEVDRLVLITEKLLMLSRADSNSLTLDIEPVNLSECLDELISDAETFHTHIRFIKQIDEHLVWRCDKALIEQLIHNVFFNAIKYNLPKGGWLEVQLKRTEQEIILKIQNSSAGVPPDLPEKAFERFYRSDSSRTRKGVDGLGLGLSISKEIAQLHRGTLSLALPASNIVCVEFCAPWSQGASR